MLPSASRPSADSNLQILQFDFNSGLLGREIGSLTDKLKGCMFGDIRETTNND